MNEFALGCALLCVGVMGYAIQRGATCTVAAVEEWRSKGSLGRLYSMFEAALWVFCGMVIARALGYFPQLPATYEAGPWTIAGGALLGVGAWVNRACVFGTVARIGNGQWAWLLSITGFYFGSLLAPLLVKTIGMSTASIVGNQQMAWQNMPDWLAWILCLVLAARAAFLLGSRKWLIQEGYLRIWQPHMATLVIGITFVIVFVLIGGMWAWTDAVAGFARQMTDGVVYRMLLLLALLVGAMMAGRTSARWNPTPISLSSGLRCLTGGAMMAVGTQMIPGSNDGLLLVGMPLLRGYAWLAFFTMVLSIYVAFAISERYSSRTTNILLKA